MNNIYIIKFLQDGKVLKDIQIEAGSITEATALALNITAGCFYWNEIKVDILCQDKE